MSNRINQQFGNYRLERLIGKGGFAEVYLGVHIHLHSQVAVKVLDTQFVSREREEFLEEARIVAALDHPSIIRVLDCGFREEDDVPFLIMNYAPNGTLFQRHPRGEIVPFPLILSYVKKIASALQYAHERKLIHRDVKPENMLIGEHDEILLSDFGIALISASSSSLSTKATAGTMSYMAPEQIMGKPRTASDQYALGIVVYEWLCGERPFRGNASELCAQHLYAPPPSLHERRPAISAELEAIVFTALAKDPQQRFACIQDFADALEAYCQRSEQENRTLSEENIITYRSAPDSEKGEPTAPRVEPQIIVAAIAPLSDKENAALLQRGGMAGIEQGPVLPRQNTSGQIAVTLPAPIRPGGPVAAVPTVVFSGKEPTAMIAQDLPSLPVIPPKKTPFFKLRRMYALLSILLMLAIIATSVAVVPQFIHAAAGKQKSIVQIPTATTTSRSSPAAGVTATPAHAASPTPGHTMRVIPTATSVPGPVILPTVSRPVAIPTHRPVVPTVTPTLIPTITPTLIPTITPSPVPPPAMLQVSPATKVDSFTDCSHESHGGVMRIDYCSFTLTNTGSGAQALNWTGSVSNSVYSISPTSGSIVPGQTQSITLTLLDACPLSVNITVTGPANTVVVPVICDQVFITPDGQSFSNSNCTNNGNWTCVVTVTANPRSQATTHWIVTEVNPDSTTFSPSSGALAPGASMQVTITIPAANCPGSNSFDFMVPGGAPDGFDNFLQWSC